MAISIIEWEQASVARRTQLLARNGTLEGLRGSLELTASIEALLADVASRGDVALLDALATFDKVDTDRIRVDESDFAEAASAIRVIQIVKATSIGLSTQNQDHVM